MENKEYNLLNENNVGGFAFFLMITAYVFISFFGQLIIGAIFGSGTVYFAICSTFSSVSMAVVLVIILSKSKTKLFSGVNVKPFKFKYLIFALAISFGMFFGLGFINDLLIGLLEKIGLSVSGVFIPLTSPWHLVVFSIVLALLPAIFEEGFFRGFMLFSLKKNRTWLAILSVSLLFALYHKSIAQFIYQFIYGVALCILCMRAKSVIPCMIAHFLNNFVVLCFEYFKISINLYSPPLIIVGLTVLLSTIAILVLEQVKEEKSDKDKKNLSIKEFWLPFALFGSVICVVLLVGNLIGV